MEAIHCPLTSLTIPSSLIAKQPTRQRSTRDVAPFITKQRHRLVKQSQLRARALSDAVTIAASTTATRGDISVLIPVRWVNCFTSSNQPRFLGKGIMFPQLFSFFIALQCCTLVYVLDCQLCGTWDCDQGPPAKGFWGGGETWRTNEYLWKQKQWSSCNKRTATKEDKESWPQEDDKAQIDRIAYSLVHAVDEFGTVLLYAIMQLVYICV